MLLLPKMIQKRRFVDLAIRRNVPPKLALFEIFVLERCRIDSRFLVNDVCNHYWTEMPPRSNGVDRTIVVLVRAMPGTALSLESSSSRCMVERVITLRTKDSSPATLCTSSTSGMPERR